MLLLASYSSVLVVFRENDTTTLPSTAVRPSQIPESHQRISTVPRRRRKPRVVYYNNGAHFSPEHRHVPHVGNATAQREIRHADDLHMTQVESKHCKLRFSWQKTQFPNCNLLHELSEPKRILGHGYWRDVWVVEYSSSSERVVFKSMRYEHDNTHRNLDRMRRDANVMERMSASPFIIDLYAFCGTSSFSEFGEGGDIVDALDESELSPLDKLRIGRYNCLVALEQACSNTYVLKTLATQAAIGLADLHNVDREGEPTIAHTDVTPGQWIKVGDRFKLNDFNRARFLPWNEKKDKLCPYYVGQNGGKFRSPEEYRYEEQTEKVSSVSCAQLDCL